MSKFNFLLLLLISIIPMELVSGSIGTLNNGVRSTNNLNGSSPTAVIFTGVDYGPNLSAWSWGDAALSVAAGQGLTANKNAMKWVMGDQWGSGWCGIGVTADPTFNLGSVWQTDSVHLTMKVEAGIDTLRLQPEGGGGKVGILFKPIDDGAWHTYSFALRDMVPQDATIGFDSSAVNVWGIMSQANSTNEVGKVVLIAEWWTGHPVIAFPSILFDGKNIPGTVSASGWGGSSIENVVGAGTTAKQNALKWTQGNAWGNGWTGVSMASDPVLDLAGAWAVDSVKFKLKCESGVKPLRIQFEDGTAKMGLVFTPTDDDAWHSYVIALKDLTPQDGTSGFDASKVKVVGLMAEGNSTAGKVIYITEWITGNPSFDVINPDAPTGIQVVPGNYANIITWNDVPNEANEKYDVYYADHPITDLSNVEVVKLGITENNQMATHLLRAPGTDQSVTYYYAIVCTDKAGNVSNIGTAGGSTTNTAKGIVTISTTVPTSFTADGDLSEWSGITPIQVAISNGTGFLVTNQVISNDADCSAKAYVAIDKTNLYVAFDVTDDIVSFNPSLSTYLNDCADLFLGFYNWHGVSHVSLKRGAQPDYHFRFAKDRLLIDGGADSILVPGANYFWGEKFVGGYTIEAKIPLANLAARSKDTLFTPAAGMRLPMDIIINDADATGQREGILTWSPFSEDHSYEDVSRWLYNWIGNKWNPDAVTPETKAGLTYNLAQNYPNPFNPTTKIRFTLEKADNVSLKVFDVLGREVATLFNGMKPAGNHTISFDASSLASGLYLYRIESGSFISVKKMMLVR